VARLGRPHGLEGFLGLYIDPDALIHFEPGSMVVVGDRLLTVRAVRPASRGHQVAFEEIPDRTGAEEIRNLDVLAAGRRRLEAEDYWAEDLIGLEVRPGGGVVIGVENGPAQDRLVIDRAGLVFLVPFVRALVPMVDLEGGYVEVLEIEGLTPE
jgi:16S rRNA processing protein RimM